MSRSPWGNVFQSIAGKLTGVLTFCLLLMVLINWLLNSFVLFDNYEREQGNRLVQCYEEINSAPRSQRTLTGLLDGYLSEYDVQALLWSETHLLYDAHYAEPLGGNRFTAPLDMENGQYVLSHRAPPHAKDGKQWLSLSARTTDGLNLLLWVPLSDVQSGAAITNRFLLWSGIGVLLLGTVLVFLSVRSVKRPVRQLTHMAEQMAHWDFTDRYVEQNENEFTTLGNSLNALSETWEATLAELKTANARLKGDMESQNRQSEARSRFIRNVSHELKTPIALIQTYAEALREDAVADADSRAYYCGVIEDEAQKLTQMLSKLTTLMQLESGKEELLIERFDIGLLLKRLLERYAPLFEERHVPVPVLPDAPFPVWGDALLIENVATNYLTNALNHVSYGGTIEITLAFTDHDTVAVRVFNTGDPIPEEDLPHLWESFYKVDKARTREYGGTGIGLSVVAAIMTAHGMPFGVANAPDGVSFFFELSVH